MPAERESNDVLTEISFLVRRDEVFCFLGLNKQGFRI
jgi:ABC-type multidrug transport system ATPase subunit